MKQFLFINALWIVPLIAFLVIFNRTFIKQLIVKMRGRTEEVMNRDASTPEGAKDYFNNAIREKEIFYNKASATFADISGKLDSTEKDLYETNKEIMRINQQLNRCIDDNNDSDAMTYAMKRETLQHKIEVLKDTIEELKEAKAHQKEIRDQAANDLTKLKEEKERTLFQLEADNQIIQLHQSMDSIASNNEGERMLEKVREGAKKTRERAEGTRIAYESSAEAADRRLEREAQDREARRIVDELKRQRGKA